MDAAFNHLTRLTNSKNYAPRVRFVIRDLLELRAQHWVSRRETFTVST
jgi:translation initiation factor 4G